MFEKKLSDATILELVEELENRQNKYGKIRDMLEWDIVLELAPITIALPKFIRASEVTLKIIKHLRELAPTKTSPEVIEKMDELVAKLSSAQDEIQKAFERMPPRLQKNN